MTRTTLWAAFVWVALAVTRAEFDDRTLTDRLTAMMDGVPVAADGYGDGDGDSDGYGFGDADALPAWPDALRARLSSHPFLRRRYGSTSSSSSGGRAVDRPKNAKDAAAAAATTATETATTATETATTATEMATTAAAAIGRTVFDTESECVSATADGGDGLHRQRPCVCYMTDYLDSVGQRLDDEGAATDGGAARSLDCTYYKAAAAVFVVRPSAGPNAGGTDDDDQTTTVAAKTAVPSSVPDDDAAAAAAAAAAPKNVDFDSVVDYRLRASEDDHYHVHYDFVGRNMKIRCLSDDERAGATIQWKYDEQKTKITTIGTDGNELSILGLEAADSKNYTCSSGESAATKGAGNSKTNRPYTHNVLAVERPIYEIRGTAAYKTGDSGTCTHEVIVPLRNQMSAYVRAETCPEGSSRYACKVVVESADCVDEGKTLTIVYSVTWNDMSSFLTKVRTSRTGQDALQYYQIVAKISNVLTANLDKTMSSQIMTRFSSVDTRFDPDYERMTIKTFVSCAPGFGVREVFCAACPPHHYGPGKSADCLKCPAGFHQPVAGSDKCVKCPNPFSSGCFADEVLTSTPRYYLYIILAIVVKLVLVIAVFLKFCCRKKDKQSIRKIQNIIKRKWRKRKNKTLLPSYHESTEDEKRSVPWQKSVINIENSLKKIEKQKSVDRLLKTPFDTIHEMFAPN